MRIEVLGTCMNNPQLLLPEEVDYLVDNLKDYSSTTILYVFNVCFNVIVTTEEQRRRLKRNLIEELPHRLQLLEHLVLYFTDEEIDTSLKMLAYTNVDFLLDYLTKDQRDGLGIIYGTQDESRDEY